MDQMNTSPTSSPARGSAVAIPVAILIGFAMIAAAIYFSNQSKNTAPAIANNQEVPTGAVEPIRPVDEKDHVRGNPNAPIVLVEYSDYDCPFCKRFHEETMLKIIDEYGTDGKVAWVYRHFPLQQLHPNAPKIALAAECVAELAGNEGFWKFSDLVYGEREINAQTDVTKLTSYAVTAGANESEFTTCLSENRHAQAVDEDFNDGVKAGVEGTPQTFVLVGGQQAPINGAQPYEAVKQIIENLLTQIEGQ